MDFPVDIVLPWLNPTERWMDTYKDYRGDENVGRIRDMGTFKYLLRSIANNVPWVNKVVVLLYDEEQKPDWLVESDKLRIVYHKEFLPEEYLPNFNSLVTDMHICFIKDVSEHFIFINDDMFFMRPVPKEMFFSDTGRSVHHPSMKEGSYTRHNKAQFRYIEENMYNFVNHFAGKKLLWKTFHMPIPFRKSFQQFMWHQYGDLIKPMLGNSHIRSNTNICNWVFYGLEEMTGFCALDDIYKKYPCVCFDLKDEMSDIPSRIADKYIACLNDGDFLTYDFERVKTDINTLLMEKFPNPCQFEQQVT